ncbi:MAG: hypothetical protein OXE92_01505 [Bacteroidetes bacterium]|nr:hypothetical protein [Bacteroidota bacterium]
MNPFIRIILPVAVAIFLTMCSNPSEPESENMPLNESEAKELMNEIMTIMADTMPKIIQSLNEDEHVIACPEGGDARVSINTTEIQPDENSDQAILTLNFGFTPNKCEVTGKEGTRFSVSSTQPIDYSYTLTIVGFFEDLEFEGELNGELNWEIENRSGVCMIDMDETLDFEVNLATNASSIMAGIACGHELTIQRTSLPLDDSDEPDDSGINRFYTQRSWLR